VVFLIFSASPQEMSHLITFRSLKLKLIEAMRMLISLERFEDGSTPTWVLRLKFIRSRLISRNSILTLLLRVMMLLSFKMNTDCLQLHVIIISQLSLAGVLMSGPRTSTTASSAP
jgi:hypothetical protein